LSCVEVDRSYQLCACGFVLRVLLVKCFGQFVFSCS